MPEKIPYRIYLYQEEIDALEAAATETGAESGNKVAAASAITCLPVWIALQKSLQSHREDFLQGVIAAIETGQPKQKR
jgi:hypothetical protein